MKKITIELLHKKLLNKEISVTSIVEEAIKKAKKYQEFNAIVHLFSTEVLELAKELDKQEISKDNYLFGIPYAIKDNLAVKGVVTSAGTKILRNFIPPYNSSVFNNLKEKAAVCIAKSTLDELGMGGTGLLSCTGHVLNPWNKKHIVGGSSSGSATLVALGVVPFALGTDTGDSIRNPASYVGVVGFKPTYGLISRYGLFSYAPSLDTIGVLTSSVRDCAIVMDALVKEDALDFSSQRATEKHYFKNISFDLSNYKLVIVKEVNNDLEDKPKKLWNRIIKKIQSQSVIIEEIEFPLELLQVLRSVYMIISYVEAASSQSNLTGINFGVRQGNELDDYQNIILKTRFQFGEIVKKRKIFGALALVDSNKQNLLLQAKKVRSKIVHYFEEIFTKYDAVLLPSANNCAPLISDVLENKLNNKNHIADDALLLANFAGSPSISIPIGLINELPFAMTINCSPFKDQKTLNIAYGIEKIVDFKAICPFRKEEK